MNKARVITLTIDGREAGAREDQTVLEVARENGIFIPTLCALPGLSDAGACRLCLVEVKGVSRLLPACCTRVAEGMEVTVDSDRLLRIHVHWLHEPAGIVRADRENGEIERSKAFSDSSKFRVKSGISGKEE